MQTLFVIDDVLLYIVCPITAFVFAFVVADDQPHFKVFYWFYAFMSILILIHLFQLYGLGFSDLFQSFLARDENKSDL